ncbi:MAG: hypothetical protein DRG78_15520 [Epsilonproteobacteria bacterium]|nr:MAG: hypothetical protein DRG78_15520 [Campylobacterota bacterium]
MKKIIILCLIYTSLFSNDLTKAMDLFNQNKFQKSIDILTKLSQNDLSNSKINFYLGRSYYKIKNYEQALIYFERIIIVNDTDLRVRLELAQTYMMLGLDYDALENFNYVLNNNIPLAVKKNIENYILYIENKKQKHIFKAMVGMGYTYDNNVNNTTDVKTFNTPILKDVAITDKKIKDTNMLFLLNGNHNYKIDDSYILENKVTLIKQEYKKEQQKNIFFISYNLNLSQYKKEDKFTYGLSYLKMEMEEKPYLNILGFSINYQKKILTDIYSFLSFSYSSKSFQQQDNKNLDSNTYGFTIGNSLPTDYYGKFNFLYIYSRENMKREDPNSSDKISNAIIVSNVYKLTDKLSITESINNSYIDEQSNDSIFLKKKKEELNTLSLGLSYNINKTVNISSTVKHIQNKSNIAIYSYEKQTIDLFIKKSF